MKRAYRNLAEFTNGLSAGQEWAVDLLAELGEAELHAEVGEEGLLWIQAAYDYDHGDPALLASILRFGKGDMVSLPVNVALLLADAVTGERVPNDKALSQMKGDPKERWDYLMAVVTFGKGLDVIRRSSVTIAEELGSVDPGHVKQVATVVNDAMRSAAMRKFEISERTLDEWLKIFRKKLKDYPKLQR